MYAPDANMTWPMVATIAHITVILRKPMRSTSRPPTSGRTVFGKLYNEYSSCDDENNALADKLHAQSRHFKANRFAREPPFVINRLADALQSVGLISR